MIVFIGLVPVETSQLESCSPGTEGGAAIVWISYRPDAGGRVQPPQAIKFGSALERDEALKSMRKQLESSTSSADGAPEDFEPIEWLSQQDNTERDRILADLGYVPKNSVPMPELLESMPETVRTPMLARLGYKPVDDEQEPVRATLTQQGYQYALVKVDDTPLYNVYEQQEGSEDAMEMAVRSGEVLSRNSVVFADYANDTVFAPEIQKGTGEEIDCLYKVRNGDEMVNGKSRDPQSYVDSEQLEFPHLENNQFIAKEDRWRLFIDYDRQTEGPNAFDKQKNGEVGYMEAMANAFQSIMAFGPTFNNLITAEHYTEIHKLATKGVKEAGRGGKDVGAKGGKQSTQEKQISYGMMAPASQEALEEMQVDKLLIELTPDDFLNSGKNGKFFPEYDSLYVDFSKWTDPEKSYAKKSFGFNGEYMVLVNHHSVEENTARMRSRIDKFNRSITSATLIRDKITSIARLIRALSVGHYFEDANRRASTFLLMNKLLVQCGISLTILRDPSLFDARVSLSKLVDAVEDGICIVANKDWPEVKDA